MTDQHTGLSPVTVNAELAAAAAALQAVGNERLLGLVTADAELKSWVDRKLSRNAKDTMVTAGHYYAERFQYFVAWPELVYEAADIVGRADQVAVLRSRQSAALERALDLPDQQFPTTVIHRLTHAVNTNTKWPRLFLVLDAIRQVEAVRGVAGS